MRMLVLFLMLLAWSAMPGAVLAQKGRNVVLIIADDMGRDMPSYGNKVIKTPNLEKLRTNGVLFTNAYSQVASCSASRASILTGLYTHQNGQFGHAHDPHDQTTHAWVQSLPFLLRRAGYFTGLIGKYHVQPDSVYPFHALMTKGTRGNRGPEQMAGRAKEFLAQAKGRPFFLVFASSDPHRSGKGFGNENFQDAPKEVRYDPKEVIVPYFLPDRPEVRKELAEYYQAVSRFDRSVGLLMDELRRSGHLNDTMIIFISDNGIPFPGAKTTLYEPGVHLPLIISSPRHEQGHTNRALVSYADLAPTILEWTGARGPKYQLPGKSLLPILNLEKHEQWDEVYGSHQFHEITMYYPMRFIRKGKYKLIINLAHKLDYPFASDLYDSPTWQGILKRGDKMMGDRMVYRYLHRPLEELYDLEADPKELKNLADDRRHAKLLQELRGRLVEWQRQTKDPWFILYRQGLTLGRKEERKTSGE